MTNPYKVSFSQTKLTAVQKSLQKALLALLKNKKLEEIPVRLLCTKAQVARSSFYAHYENTDDILNEIEDQLVKSISDLDQNIVDANRKNSSDFTYFSQIIDFINAHEETLRTLLIKNYDHRLVEKWKKAIKAHLWTRLNLVKIDVKQDLIFEMITSGILMDKSAQKKSLKWIREQSLDPNCIESQACHDASVKPHTTEF